MVIFDLEKGCYNDKGYIPRIGDNVTFIYKGSSFSTTVIGPVFCTNCGIKSILDEIGECLSCNYLNINCRNNFSFTYHGTILSNRYILDKSISTRVIRKNICNPDVCVFWDEVCKEDALPIEKKDNCIFRIIVKDSI